MTRRPCCGGKLHDRGTGSAVRGYARGAATGPGAMAVAVAIALGGLLVSGSLAGVVAAPAESVPPLKVLSRSLAAPGGSSECPIAREMCVLADESGEIDVKTGVADLRGNVRGYLRSRELEFSAQTLRAEQQGKRVWRRLELNGSVDVTQPGRRITADHGIIEPTVATLFGKARLDATDRWLEGDEIVVDDDSDRVTAKGTATKPLVIFVADPAPETEEEPDPKPAAASPEGQAGNGTQVRAQRAVMEEQGRTLQLTGAVHVVMALRKLVIDAESVILQFAEDQTLVGFQARGNVAIVQPGRHLNADTARSQNRMQTILLLGKARMQQEGQFDLNSDRLEVFTDSKRGAVRSEDRQRPMTLSLDLGAKPWRLDAPGMEKLKAQGVSDPVLKKLEPIQGKTFASQSAFQQAVSDRLSAEESEQYLSTIVSQAKP